MNYIGIDVGSGKYFVISYAQHEERIERKFFDNVKEIYKYLPTRKGIIAIDAPSGPRTKEDERRECEKDLGIGGYFATPYCKEVVQPWMKSGFELWEFLQDNGFKRGITFPTKNGNLIEIHPTVIFKKLMNPESAPNLWISRKNPVSKKKAKGKTQRREILKKRFPGQEEVINMLSIDYLDALIAAHTAKQSYKGEVEIFGDPNEGQIWFPLN